MSHYSNNLYHMRSLKFLALMLLPFFACERNSGSIAIDFVDGTGFEAGYFDTIEVISTSETLDSLVTLNPSSLLIGKYIDPIFGSSSSQFVSEFVLASVAPDFGDSNVTIDSAFILLPYSGWYGDTTADFGIKISHLDDEIMDDSLYYSTSNFSSSNVICDTVVKPYPNKRVIRTGMFDANQVMFLKIDKGFIKSNIIEASKMDPSLFETNENFVDYFKGLAFEGYPSNKAIFNITPGESDFRIRIYYSNDSLRADTIGPGYNYLDILGWRGITGNNYGLKSVNLFEFDRSNSQINLDNQDTTNGEVTSYVQSMGGIVTSVSFKNLNQFRDSNYFVNHAELEIPIREGSALEYTPPVKLNAFMISGHDKILMQEYLDASPGGGLTIQSVLRDKKYNLEVTKFVQQILSRKDSTEDRLLLLPDGNASTPRRVVLNGNLDPVLPISLKLYLTKRE